jgi:O-antigen/teichoic acid export membrane protein
MMALYTPDRARRSLFHTVTYRAMSQVTTVLGYVVLVRGLSKQDFGVFSLLYAFIPLISTVASLGLEQTLRRFQPEFLRLGQHAAAAWLVRVVAAARLGMNAVVLTIVLLGWSFAAPLFKLTPYRPEFELFSVLVLLHFQVNILQLTLASHMLHRFSVGSTSVLSGGKLLAYLVLLGLHRYPRLCTRVRVHEGCAPPLLRPTCRIGHVSADRAGAAPTLSLRLLQQLQ